MRIFTELSKRLAYIESHIEQEIDDIEEVAVDRQPTEGVGHHTLGKYQRILVRDGDTGTVIPPRKKSSAANP